MKAEDSLLIRALNREANTYEQLSASGVFCTVINAISSDNSGFFHGGQLIVRIPERESVPVLCGDEISHDGGVTWFTVTEIRDNRKQGSGLSHRKVIGRR
ncbi:MAG: hypothetical protein IKD21_06025 [Clostridia bacterium]|nr:hypothetical protein [Clostridia bacterium]